MLSLEDIVGSRIVPLSSWTVGQLDCRQTDRRVETTAHNAAPFLAWHRYFLHVYESSLQHDCHYEGHLT